MTLTTHCPDCRCPLVTKLPPDTTEAEAQAIAARLYCVPCAIHRQIAHTAPDMGWSRFGKQTTSAKVELIGYVRLEKL